MATVNINKYEYKIFNSVSSVNDIALDHIIYYTCTY